MIPWHRFKLVCAASLRYWSPKLTTSGIVTNLVLALFVIFLPMFTFLYIVFLAVSMFAASTAVTLLLTYDPGKGFPGVKDALCFALLATGFLIIVFLTVLASCSSGA